MDSRPSNPLFSLLLAPALASALMAQTPASAPAQGPTASRPVTTRPAGGAPPSDDAFKMGSPPSLAPGLTEEQMWPAADAETWAKPVLIRWQRTFDDALRTARAKNQPILVCVNMDGEIASEHFAGVRYRDPATAELMTRYACVIASVYRHTPRDYDEEGRRVECPRFQTVTCGEHIEAERELYEKYFEGKRISPRHIVLGLDEKETLDVYFSWDTATVMTTFRKGIEGWPAPKEHLEQSLDELTKSADVEDRERLEKMYLTGTRAERKAILESLRDRHVVDQQEVLRAAVFGLDLELATIGRRALAQCTTEGSLDLMAQALQIPMEESERAVLLAGVERMAKSSPRARTLASLQGGLGLKSAHIDAQSLAKEYDAGSDRRTLLDERARTAAARPAEPMALLELAEALVARAQESSDRRYNSLLWQDAQAAAREAEKLGAKGPRVEAAVAVIAAELGELETARKRALVAVESGMLTSADPNAAPPLTRASKARLLALFGDARQRAIRAAFRSGEKWPPQWLADLNTAYSILLRERLTGITPILEFYDFLRWVGATARASSILEEALVSFPDSPVVHERLREKLLWEGGAAALERGYAERVKATEVSGAGPSPVSWFAGYAMLVAAEHYRRRNELEPAERCYRHAMELYQRYETLFPEGGDSCDHFSALAHAALSRMAMERSKLEEATEEILAALKKRPDSAATPDGLSITPVATALMVKAALLKAGDEGRAEKVQGALDALDPKLLEAPPTEPANLGRGRGRVRSGQAPASRPR